MQPCFEIGFLQSFLVGFEVLKAELVNGTNPGEEFLPLAIVEQDLEVIRASDPVVILAGRTYVQTLFEFKGRAGVFALRAPCPQTIRGFLFLGGGGADAFFYTSEPAACGIRLSVGGWFQAVEWFVFLGHVIEIFSGIPHFTPFDPASRVREWPDIVNDLEDKNTK
jgi:hypothetical protein